MTTIRLSLLGLAAVALAATQTLGAASATSNVTVSATVAATAKLSLSSSTVSFANADPDTTPSIAATEGAITITAKGKTSTGSTITLTVLAADDLKSGTDAIADHQRDLDGQRRGVRRRHDEQDDRAVGRLVDQLRQPHRHADLRAGQLVELPDRQLHGDGHLHADRPVGRRSRRWHDGSRPTDVRRADDAARAARTRSTAGAGCHATRPLVAAAALGRGASLWPGQRGRPER